MITDRDLRRQAYMDGELPVDEIIRFEAECTDPERAEMEAERAFESALVEQLQPEAECPDQLWIDLQQRMRTRKRRPSIMIRFGLAAAACLAIALAILQHHSISVPLEQPQTADLAVPGSWEKVRSSLTANDFHVSLSPPEAEDHHPISLVGLRYHDVGGDQIAEVRFTCCGHPVSVFLSHSQEIDLVGSLKLPEKTYRFSQPLDGYQLLAVGRHAPSEILNLFS